MGWFVFGVIFLIIALIMLGIGKVDSDAEDIHFSLRPWSIIPFALFFIFLLLSALRTVGAGEVGVPITFGHAGQPLQSGVHIVAPWTGVQSLSIQDQNYTMSHTQHEGSVNGNDTVPVNTKDNANVDVDSTIIYRISPTSAQKLYVNLGADYVNKIVRPTIRSAIRDEAVNFDAVSITTSARGEYERGVQARIENALTRYNVQVKDVKIRDIILPEAVQHAVNDKVAAFQESQKQQFVLQTTTQQAQQRVAEANGLAQAQAIINSTLTQPYLEHEYITTMQKLVGSPNTTFLFLPNNPGALPQIVLPQK